MKLRHVLSFTALALAAPLHAQSTGFGLQKGDHVALVGNGLADRQQHFGWLEALVHKANPDKDLVVRNLAFAGDEVETRLRSENFGSPEDWLNKVGADVVFAFFGFNESFKGQDGLADFRRQLDGWLKKTKAGNFGGSGGTRIVLFSPTAFEDTKDPNLPDGREHNERLRYYAEAMAEVAKANDVPFVDLFTASQKLYAAAGAPLTIDGVHFKDAGDKALAPVVFEALFGAQAPSTDDPAVQALRQAVLEKNREWHLRYRTVDGYNVYGGRSALAYKANDGGFISNREAPNPYISNYKVMQEEMSVRDVMTANRDQKVWAVAKGADPKSVKVDDSNVPAVTKVPTNKPGDKPDGLHTFLSGEAAIAKMTLPKGVKCTLFADEKMFPELVNPVQMAWDTKGRLWVAAWLNYPSRTPWSKKGDSLLILEDTDGDNKADKCTTFTDALNCPTGFQFHKDGVIVMQSPNLVFLRDTDGDDKADWSEKILMGLDAADSHHETNSMCYEPGGAIYCSDGVFHRTQVESIHGPVRNHDGCIYRYEPATQKFERYMAYGFANPHGRVFDRWGNDFITDATGNNNYFGPASSGFLDEPKKHSNVKDFWDRPSRPCPGTGILSSRAWPEEYRESFLNLNVISIQGCFRVKVSEDGAGLKGETQENLFTSSDPNFRPSAISVAPDGSVYFCDWANAIIGHMQHHLRDPNRDNLHGRVYRLTHADGKLLAPAKIHGQPVEALLELLKSPENNVRERAKIELGKHDSATVAAAAKKWAAALDKADPEVEHHRLEALWVHQWHNVVDVDLLKQVLASPEPKARAQAVRVLCYWRDRVPDVLALLRTAATDDAPRVRLEAVRACSFFRTWEAADIALLALTRQQDYWLDYTLKETLGQLEPWWKTAIADGKPLSAGNPAGVAFVLGNVSTADLPKLPKTEPVLQALLTRAGVSELDRLGALAELATQKKSTPAAELIKLITATKTEDLARLLARQPADELKAVRPSLVSLAKDGPDLVRAAARAALMSADGSMEVQWNGSTGDVAGLSDFLRAVPLVSDPTLRATAFAKVSPLLKSFPPAIQAKVSAPGAEPARYVRIELPRRGTLTLAEVEVMADGRNVALKRPAKQSSTAFGGDASRGVDGNTNGDYNAGGQTHTSEGEQNPWWEVDLGSPQSVELVRVMTRTDGEFYKRLDGFTLTLLDANRREVFRQAGIPGPRVKVDLPIRTNPAGALRRAAIAAVVSTNQEPAAVFTDLASLVTAGTERIAAASALAKLPRSAWNKASGAAVAKSLVQWARTVPAEERTSEDYVKTMQLATDLTALLPENEAATARGIIRSLGVAVFVVKTVHEQLRFDTQRLVVEAGKPFEVIFENDDAMPHNFVFVRPGSHTEVGTAAQTMAPPPPGSDALAYVPKSDKVLAATRLLEPGQKQTLKLTAPATEGSYEFVCTFPGHWMVMWGQVIVTKDVEAYLKAHPVPELPGAGK